MPSPSTVPYPKPMNWLARIYCFGCEDQMIPEPEDGWRCLTCGGTLMFEDDEHWHWRPEGFYDETVSDVDEWKGEVDDATDDNHL